MDVKYIVREITKDSVYGTVTVFYGPYDREQDAVDLVDFVETNSNLKHHSAYIETLFSPIFVND